MIRPGMNQQCSAKGALPTAIRADGGLIRARAAARLQLPLFGVLLVCATGLYAWSRGGMFDLPGVPSDLTLQVAGLEGLAALAAVDATVRATDGSALNNSQLLTAPDGTAVPDDDSSPTSLPVDERERLERLRQRLLEAPNNLAIGNAYRMEVFRLRREFLSGARQRGELTPVFPPDLDRQPVAFFEDLVQRHPLRETKLQVALAWVDEMLLFPALEVKAPASVEAVKILTEVIDDGNAYYVPALFARGLNYLHRPSRLVWPETTKTPIDAAVRDVGLCLAIGRKLGVGSPRLRATLAMTLGDAHVKAGHQGVARSWWQVAQNLCHDDDIQEAVRRRYGWRDEEILDRLEEELDRARQAVDRPMTDLALMWN